LEDDVVLIADYAHPACGILSEETKQVIGLCARLDGTMTDPVHEGESMQGTIDLVKKVFFREARKCSALISALRRGSWLRSSGAAPELALFARSEADHHRQTFSNEMPPVD